MANTRKTKKKVIKPEPEEIELDYVGDEVEEEPTVVEGNGIAVTTTEPVNYIGTGLNRIKFGGTKVRVFSKEVHGKDFKKIADEFIATCKTNDGQNRPKFVKVEKV